MRSIKNIRIVSFFILTFFLINVDYSISEELKAADFGNNPFEMRGGKEGDSGFVSAAFVDLPPGIRVLGILVVKGQNPIGVLEMPGMPDVFFVKSGDVIQIEFSGRSGKTDTGISGIAHRQLYLLVQSVTAQEIVLAPQTRPQDSRVYR